MMYHRGYWKARYEGELLKSKTREELEALLKSKMGEAPASDNVQWGQTTEQDEEETWTNY